MTLRRPLRIALIAVAAVIGLAVAGGAVFLSQFDPNSLKPRIIEAVKRATGRDLTLNGKIGLEFALRPRIRVKDVAFANPPGFSRPQMATLQSLELELGLLPLLSSRIEIDRLVLIHPDILLETTATGQTNWQMTPEPSPQAPPSQQTPQTAAKTRTSVSVDTIRIQDGTLAYRDDATNKTTTLGLPKFEAKSSSPDAPFHMDADAVYGGTAFSLTADTGGLTRLQDPASTTPWPVKLALTAAGAKLTADGSLTRPLQGKGYNLTVSGSVPDAAALAPLLQSFTPPPLHDVSFAAKVTDTGGKLPEFSTLTLHVGASDLSARLPGLKIDKLDIDAPKTDQPMKIDAGIRMGDTPLTATGTFGSPALLLPDAKPAPFPVDLTFHAATATATAKGTIADARALTGMHLALTAQIPDLSALSSLTRHPLPTVKSVAFQGTLTDAAGGLPHGAILHGVTLTSSAGDLAGDAAIGLAAHPSLTATFKSSRIDLDALQAAVDQSPPGPPSDAAPPPAPKRRGEPLFPTQPIPFDLLRTADADLKLDISDIHTGGADYKAITTHAVLSNGKLTVDPFAADLPGGHLSGTIAVDAALAVPSVHVVLHAPGLALKTILTATHQPAYAMGNVEIYADLTGTGDSPHAIASSLGGSLGLAMAGGSIDNRLMGNLLGKLLDSLSVLNLVGKGGSSDLKCFAMRMDAQHGVGAIKALALSSSLLTMSGSGTVNLGPETLAMAVRPQARVAGTGLIIPVAVSGPIRDPAIKVNDLGAAEANAGTVAGVVIGGATGLGIVGGLLGADKLLGGGTDICPPALAAARGQAMPEPTKTEQPSIAKPGSLLKNLFR